MPTPIQDSLVAYHPGVDIIIHRGPEPVRPLRARDEPLPGKTLVKRLRHHAYSPDPAHFTDGYNAAGARSLPSAEMAGRIIDTYA